jgi:hypothetical protein
MVLEHPGLQKGQEHMFFSLHLPDLVSPLSCLPMPFVSMETQEGKEKVATEEGGRN